MSIADQIAKIRAEIQAKKSQKRKSDPNDKGGDRKRVRKSNSREEQKSSSRSGSSEGSRRKTRRRRKYTSSRSSSSGSDDKRRRSRRSYDRGRRRKNSRSRSYSRDNSRGRRRKRSGERRNYDRNRRYDDYPKKNNDWERGRYNPHTAYETTGTNKAYYPPSAAQNFPNPIPNGDENNYNNIHLFLDEKPQDIGKDLTQTILQQPIGWQGGYSGSQNTPAPNDDDDWGAPPQYDRNPTNPVQHQPFPKPMQHQPFPKPVQHQPFSKPVHQPAVNLVHQPATNSVHHPAANKFVYAPNSQPTFNFAPQPQAYNQQTFPQKQPPIFNVGNFPASVPPPTSKKPQFVFPTQKPHFGVSHSQQHQQQGAYNPPSMVSQQPFRAAKRRPRSTASAVPPIENRDQNVSWVDSRLVNHG